MLTLQESSITAPAERISRHPLVRYFACLFCIPLLLYPLAFLIVRLPSYEQWSASPWGPALEYSFAPHQPDADIVIFGDSSAFLGIDPRILNKELGVRTLVLPDTAGSIPVTGSRPLDLYLAHHPAPRLIVLYFSPWNLQFRNVTQSRLFEGEEMLLRHSSRREILNFELHHPTELLVFPFRLYSTFGPRIVRAAMHHVNRMQAVAAASGHVDFTDPFPALPPDCAIPQAYAAAGGTQSVQELAQRYSTPNTQVLVYIAPIPACRKAAQIASRDLTALNAAPSTILPRPAFVGDAYYAHTDPASVPLTSHLLSEAVRRRFPGLAHPPPQR